MKSKSAYTQGTIRIASHREYGATLVEASLTLSIFSMALFSLLEFSLIVYRYVALQHALSITSRELVVGVSGEGLTRELFMKHKLQEQAAAYGISLPESSIRVCPLLPPPQRVGECPQESAGEPNEFFSLSAYMPVTFFGRELTTLQSSVVMLNEPR